MNVLSIDIDFLFTEMRKYHKFINEDIEPEKAWECMKIIKPELTFKPDGNTTKWLLNVLKIKCKEAKETFLIEEHDQIVPILRELKCNQATMYNIDYHHDITYEASITDLDISNWVLHSRHENLIKDYKWIKQDDSDMCGFRAFTYQQDSWKDVDVNILPNFDYVIFCVSKHYTPVWSWGVARKLKSWLDMEIRNRFTESDPPIFDITEFKEFDGLECVEDVERVYYQYKGFYVESEKFFGVNWLSFINLGKRKLNVLTQCNELLGRLIKKDTIGFSWETGYKSEVLIKRLVRKYDIINTTVKGNRTEILLKKE